MAKLVSDSVEEIHSVGTINNVETSYFTWVGMQDPTNSATHGTRWFPGHVLHRAVNSQDVTKMSDGHQNVVIRLLTYFQLCKVCFYVIRLLTAHCPKQQPIFFTKILGKHRHGLLNVSENDKCKCNCTLKGLNDDDQQQNVGLPSKSATPRCSCIDDFCSFRPIIHVICM